MENDMKLLQLADGSKWLTIAKTVYNNETYKYLLGVNDAEDDITEDVKVMREYMQNGEKYMQVETDDRVLKTVIPLLIPEAKEYIDNPEKLKELL